MKTISRNEAENLIKTTGGKIFGVRFVKKDFTVRIMSCRLGVKKGVKGVGRSYKPEQHGLIGVYDMNNGFRMVNLNTLEEVKFKGQTYEVD